MLAQAEPALDATLAGRDYVPRPRPFQSEPEFLDDPTPSVFEFELGNETWRAEIPPGKPTEWLRSIVKRLDEISGLQVNWDSYGALRVRQDILVLALKVAYQLFVREADYRVPQIHATPEGGVVFEWHDATRDLEVTIRPGEIVTGYYYGGAPNDEWEGPVGHSLEELAPYLERLAKA